MTSTVTGYIRSRHRRTSLKQMNKRTRMAVLSLGALICLSAFSFAAFDAPNPDQRQISGFELMMISVF